MFAPNSTWGLGSSVGPSLIHTLSQTKEDELRPPVMGVGAGVLGPVSAWTGAILSGGIRTPLQASAGRLQS